MRHWREIEAARVYDGAFIVNKEVSMGAGND